MQVHVQWTGSAEQILHARYMCVCVVCVPSLDRFNVCHGVCVYVCKCILHEYLRTRFHLCNNVSVLYVCICVCAQCFEKNTMNRSIYIRMHCVHKLSVYIQVHVRFVKTGEK